MCNGTICTTSTTLFYITTHMSQLREKNPFFFGTIKISLPSFVFLYFNCNKSLYFACVTYTSNLVNAWLSISFHHLSCSSKYIDRITSALLSSLLTGTLTLGSFSILVSALANVVSSSNTLSTGGVSPVGSNFDRAFCFASNVFNSSLFTCWGTPPRQ